MKNGRKGGLNLQLSCEWLQNGHGFVFNFSFYFIFNLFRVG